MDDFILFLYKLRIGNFGLAKTFWLFLIGAWLAEALFLFGLIFLSLGSFDELFHLFFSIVYLPNAVLGVWNAASRYAGFKLWAWGAKAVVVIIVALYLYSLYMMIMIQSNMLAINLHQHFIN